MLAKQHLQYGIIATAGVALIFPEVAGYVPQFLASGILGSLLPDIDDPNTRLGRVVRPISTIINKIFGHRMITHDMGFVPLLAIFTIGKYPGLLGLFLGMGTHYILDAQTVDGLPFFGKKRAIHLLPKCLRFKANSAEAKIATVITCVLTIAALCGIRKALFGM